MSNKAHEFNTAQFERVLAELYQSEDHAELRSLLLPLMSMQGRLPAYILRLARGQKNAVQQLVDLAHQDWRDVLVLVESRKEFGLEPDPELEEFARSFGSGRNN